MKKIIFLILIIFVSTLTYSQTKKTNFEKRKEFVKTERIAFITGKLNLSPEEAEKFWPVYNQYINKQEEIIMSKRKNMHKLMSNNDISDAEAHKIVDNYIKLTQQETDLVVEYNKKFEKVLPIKKVALLYQAEKQFKRYLMKKLRANKRKNNHK